LKSDSIFWCYDESLNFSSLLECFVKNYFKLIKDFDVLMKNVEIAFKDFDLEWKIHLIYIKYFKEINKNKLMV
jgi:hypothetical protein